MSSYRVFTLASAVLLMSACHKLERSGTCAAISDATRAEIRLRPENSTYVITDPVRLHDLVAFANARRESSQGPYTMPSPRATAAFYEADRFLGTFGVGSDFFFVSCENWKGTRPASADEITRFQIMIRAPEENGSPAQKK